MNLDSRSRPLMRDRATSVGGGHAALVPAVEEYAHIDLFTYAGSEQLFWAPTLDWIRAHTVGRDGPPQEIGGN